MFNKNYTGRKDIRKKEVFNSQNIWPSDWFVCLESARSKDYEYIDFNGNVYAVKDYKDGESVDYSKAICEREDLVD